VRLASARATHIIRNFPATGESGFPQRPPMTHPASVQSTPDCSVARAG
jgi:hypothetical protein